MPVHPPKDLSRHVAVRKILAASGVTVNDRIPQATSCPFCVTDRSLSIYRDPIIAGNSLWLHCSNCDFRGDTIDAFAHMHDIADLKKAISMIMREGYFDGPVHEFGNDDIDRYVQNYPMRRRRTAHRWDQLRELVLQLDPRALHRIQASHLWYGWGKAPQERISRFLGGCTRKDLIRIFNDPSVTRKDGYASVLVLNYQDVPGRTCAFEFVGEGDSVMKFHKPLHDRRGREGGLAMLESLEAFEDTVYAVDNPGVALRMHSRYFHDWTKPLKLVLYNALTKNAWRAVKAERVIFWSNKNDAAIINHARNVENGYITRHPNLEDHHHLSGVAFPRITEMMERNAKPWREFLLSRVLRTNVDPREAKALIRHLQLNLVERGELKDLCPKSSRSRLEELLEDEHSAHLFREDGKDLVERADGWFDQKGGRGEELVCNARPYIRREMLEKDSGEVRWEGSIIFNRMEIPFSSNLEEIESGPIKWLRRILVRSELGTPIISRSFARRLPNVMRRVSTYATVTVSRRIGVREDGSILFPTFHIKDGKITSERTFMTASNMPALNMRVPKRMSRRFTEQITSAYPIYAALASTFMANLLSSRFDEEYTPVAVVGDHGSLARESMRMFADRFGMNTRVLKRGAEKAIMTLRDGLDAFGYPTFVDPVSEGMLQFWPSTNADHVYVATTTLEASALALNGGWAFINAPGFDMELARTPAHDPVFLYLADLQRRGYELEYEKEKHFIVAVLKDFLSWYGVYLRQDMGMVMEKALDVLRFQEHAGDELVRTAIQLYRSGRLAIDRAPVIDTQQVRGKAGVVIDEVGGQVLVRRENLLRAFTRAKLPWPDLRKATEDLKTRKLLHPCGAKFDGWVVPRSTWEGSVGGCLG